MPDTPDIRRGILIPVRLASERLPGKALLDVAGQPALYHLLDRAAACRFVDRAQVVVCTTEEASDDPLAEAVEAWGAAVFRGERDDLIRRFAGAIDAFGFTHVVEADGDDLCCATEYMDRCFEALAAAPDLDVVTCTGLPLGIAPRGFTRGALEKVLARYVAGENDTGFFHFFTRTGLCACRELPPDGAHHTQGEARLTLDYEDDLTFFRRVLGEIGAPGTPASLTELVAHLNLHPDLIGINAGMNEDFWARTAEKTRLRYRDAEGRSRDIQV